MRFCQAKAEVARVKMATAAVAAPIRNFFMILLLQQPERCASRPRYFLCSMSSLEVPPGTAFQVLPISRRMGEQGFTRSVNACNFAPPEAVAESNPYGRCPPRRADGHTYNVSSRFGGVP